MKIVTPISARKYAGKLARVLREDRSVDVKQSDVVEAFAKALGFRTSNAMMAWSPDQAATTTEGVLERMFFEVLNALSDDRGNAIVEYSRIRGALELAINRLPNPALKTPPSDWKRIVVSFHDDDDEPVYLYPDASRFEWKWLDHGPSLDLDTMDEVVRDSLFEVGIVVEAMMPLPRTDKYGIPEIATDSGMSRYLTDVGISHVPDLAVYSPDMGDDGSYPIHLLMALPMDIYDKIQRENKEHEQT